MSGPGKTSPDRGGGATRPAAERVQTKLAVSDRSDPMEHEADQVAQRVVAGQPAAVVSRMAGTPDEEPVSRAESPEKKPEQAQRAAGPEKKDAKPVQRAAAPEKKPEQVQKASAPEKRPETAQRAAGPEKKDAKKPESAQRAAAPEKKETPAQKKSADGGSSSDAMSSAAQHAVDSKGPGQPMDSGVRSKIESSLGSDLSHVRVHDDAAARQSADSINARAFTHGSDIWMGPGESSSDLSLMAHEATHVVQQTGAAQRLVQRDPAPTPAPVGGAPGVSPEQALQDLKTFRLPGVKGRHRPVYEAWAARGALTRVAGYDRGEPDQKDSVWLPGVTIAQDKLDALDLTPGFKGRKTIQIGTAHEIEGTYSQLLQRLKVPDWGRDGTVLKHSLEVDHIVELQVGSWSGSAGAANEIQNMELLDKSSNASAGSQTKNSVKENVRRYLEATGQSATEAAINTYRNNNDIQFDRVVPGDGGAGNSQWWTKVEIETGEQLKGAKPLVNTGEAGSAHSFALVSPGGTVLGQYAHEEGVASIDVNNEVDQKRVAGLIITSINRDAGYLNAARDDRVGTISCRLELPPQLNALDTPLTVPLHSAGQYSAYLGSLPQIRGTHFQPMSLIEFDPPGVEGRELVIRGRLTPSIPLLGPTPIDVAIRGHELEFFYAYSAGALALPLPGISIDDATLIVAFGTAGFRVEGAVYFSVQRLGHGVLNASVGTTGGFELGGSFDFDSELFDEARIEAWYRERAFGGRGTLRINTPGKVRGIKSLEAQVTFGENQVAANGTVQPDIPGVENATLTIQYSEADGLVIGGSATLGSQVPGIRSGQIEAQVRRPPDGGPWEVAAHGTAVPAIPGVDTTLTVDYAKGALTITGSADYARGMLSGHVELGATNRVMGADGTPTDEVGPDMHVYGGGTLTVRIAPWLQGTVGVRFLPNGEIELTGRIALPDALDLFPEKRLDKNIFRINLDIPILGFAVAGQRVGIFATIGGGLDLSAGIGPGQLRDLGIGITYNPDHEDQTHITGGARLVIPAHAGLRLFIRGALGAGIPIVSASLGLEVGGSIGLEGAVEASVNVDWTPTTGLAIDALGEIYVQPKFKFDLTGFLTVDADLFITTINLYEKRWQLAAFELGPNLRFGVRLPIHYREGQPFDISMDDLQFDVPDVDTDALLTDLIHQIV